MDQKDEIEKTNRLFYNCRQTVAHYRNEDQLSNKEERAFRHIPATATILDLGCGTGRTTTHLYSRNYSVIGVDYAHAMTHSASERLPDVPFCTADAKTLCFRDDSFDVVLFSFNGIDYIHPYSARLAALREIWRVLKPDGLFIFSTHNNCFPRSRDGIRPFFKTLLKGKRETIMQDDHYKWGRTTIRLTTPAIQVNELRDAGFRMKELVSRKRLMALKSYPLLGLLDDFCYYVCTPRNRS
ncbi:MAG: class I SAM-dependent methyltransferase [Magnetococcales bacterium]|nr:class I SAM-dependent methyltransferase [Magnetococcales bacterium]